MSYLAPEALAAWRRAVVGPGMSTWPLRPQREGGRGFREIVMTSYTVAPWGSKYTGLYTFHNNEKYTCNRNKEQCNKKTNDSIATYTANL